MFDYLVHFLITLWKFYFVAHWKDLLFITIFAAVITQIICKLDDYFSCKCNSWELKTVCVCKNCKTCKEHKEPVCSSCEPGQEI